MATKSNGYGVTQVSRGLGADHPTRGEARLERQMEDR
jgi:hypothetical protein